MSLARQKPTHFPLHVPGCAPKSDFAKWRPVLPRVRGLSHSARPVYPSRDRWSTDLRTRSAIAPSVASRASSHFPAYGFGRSCAAGQADRQGLSIPRTQFADSMVGNVILSSCQHRPCMPKSKRRLPQKLPRASIAPEINYLPKMNCFSDFR